MNKKIIWLLIVLVVIVGGYYVLKGHKGVAVADKDTIRIATGGEPSSLDPNMINGQWEFYIVQDLFEGLMSRAANGNLIPGVATSYKVSNNGKTYIFFLRKDAKWSDGVPVTAADFEFSMKRELNPKTAASYASLLYLIKGGEAYNQGKASADTVGVKAINDYTLRIDLTTAASYFPQLLANSAYFPIPKHIVEKYGNGWSKPEHIVSNGAYKVVRWEPKSYVKSTINKYYWDSKDIKIKNIIYYTQDDGSAVLKRYRSNEIDYITDFASSQYQWINENIKHQAHVTPVERTYWYSINLNDAKFKDPRVRLALNISIDRDFLVKKVLKAGQISAYGLVPPMTDYLQVVPSWSKKTMNERIIMAKKLLEEAGYSSTHPLSFTLSYNTSRDNNDVAVAAAAMWQKIGINVKLYNKEVTTHFADLNSGNYEIGRSGWQTDYDDPSSMIGVFLKASGNNSPRFYNKEFENDYWKGVSSQNLKQRMDYYHQAEKIFLDDNAIVPLYYSVNLSLIKPRVIGWKPNVLNVHLTRYLSLSN